MQENIAYDSTNFANELRQYRQWVCYDANKRPLNPLTGEYAASDNPATWTDFETAAAALKRNVGVGLGFMLSERDPFAVIDLDDPTDPKHRFTQEQIHSTYALQQQIHETFDSYSEVSPSGNEISSTTQSGMRLGRKHG